MMEPICIGIGGPVGAGKTQLIERITRRLNDEVSMAAITNDIYTIEDAKILAANGVLPLDRIIGIETGGCNLKTDEGLDSVIDWLKHEVLMLDLAK
jgi:urease accessory protein